jgi:hypothetical protein
MDGFMNGRRIESLKIPDRRQVQGDGAVLSLPQTKPAAPVSLNEGLFYEIEYDACPIPGVGKFVLKPQKIEVPETDEIRGLFHQMRDIARAQRITLDHSRFFDRRIHHESAIIFYRQGIFMKDFTDDYEDTTPFSSYYPYYQLMGYEQLRTYFTWRTKVRKGNVPDNSLSYAFLYIYELLNNIGTDDPQDGLTKLIFFWKAFRVHNNTIDKYVLRWLKDYHIYYELPQSFKAFVEKNELAAHYPKTTNTENSFDLFCGISKYDIRRSAFFVGEKVKLITDCFCFVIDKLRQIFMDNGIHFDDLIFQPTKLSVWTPFKDALFYPSMNQPDRRIVLSENEIYICRQNHWAYSTVLTTESGRQLIGYVMKQMESVLRKVTKYKFKLSANLNTVTHAAVDKLKETGLSLEKIVSDATAEFYREATKTVVRVDYGALSRIRQEALAIQEKLIVPEQEEPSIPVMKSLGLSASRCVSPIPSPDNETAAAPGVWESFKNALSSIEIGALSLVLRGGTELKKFADECGIMLEVLVDGINEKAMDFIGDSLMDEEFTLYGDYQDQLKELVG